MILIDHEEKSEWMLHIGCHRGTLVSRDMEVSPYISLEVCRQAVKEAEEMWAEAGYFVWFAYAIGPDGERVDLHRGTPYI